MGIFDKFKKGSKDGEYYLALDIGTEMVKSIVFRIDEESTKGVVVGIGKERQKRNNMQSGAISDINGVIEICKKSISQAKKMAGVDDVSHAVMGVAGELVKGTTTTVHYDRANPSNRMELPELKEIIQRVQWKALERIREQMEWELGRSVDVKLINAAIVDVRIDGYRVANPLNFQGKNLSISIFNSYAPLMHLGAIDMIAQELNLDLMRVAAEPYAVSASVGYEDILDFNGIFIDIGGGTTDIAVVRNGGLEGTKMFALGGRAFTKRLAQSLRIPFEEAETLKIKYTHGKLQSNVSEQFSKILLQDSLVWLGGVELSLMEFADKDLLPSNIYLCGGGSALPEIGHVLLETEWVKKLPFTKSLSVNFLQPRDVIHMIDETGELDNPQDVTPLALANLAVSELTKEKEISRILKKAMKDVQK
ncbi:MAG: cell division FtsA domain-containing protein [Candidatus Moraniibacteriota bacterium]|jgi:cell division protein FtsA